MWINAEDKEKAKENYKKIAEKLAYLDGKAILP